MTLFLWIPMRAVKVYYGKSKVQFWISSRYWSWWRCLLWLINKLSSIFLNLDTIYIIQNRSNLFDTWDGYLWQTWFKGQMKAGHKYQYKSNAHNIQLCTTSNTFVNNLKIGHKYIICKVSWSSKVMKFKERKEYTHPTESNCTWAVEKNPYPTL